MKSSKRKGDYEKAKRARQEAEDLDVDMAIKKKELTRFTKMVLSVELRQFANTQMTTLLSGLSTYASASVVAYQQLTEMWQSAGVNMCSNFPERVDQAKASYGQMKESISKQEEEKSGSIFYA